MKKLFTLFALLLIVTTASTQSNGNKDIMPSDGGGNPTGVEGLSVEEETNFTYSITV